jgi:hypothetical protein
MVWSIILMNAKGPLVFLKKGWCTNAKGTVDLNVYIKHILPLISAFQEDYERREGEKEEKEEKARKPFIYLEDNASIHELKATRAAFLAPRIPKGFWLANSSDLNPIENVWQMLKYRLGNVPPASALHVGAIWRQMFFCDLRGPSRVGVL